ncbi:hypothetical protein O4H49_04365 [Kiloniella laminariae]|uniref:Uncharacterized protein n=1 Tax=Kiloniella laminariae TaxID=454162 RepID=A0ABT4LFX7_9PROT|nr:hypothetical protein [Kiloniella laminariae]MCZ4279999.1 hypothetical protein [Kiloniella laminariae]
MSLTNSYKGHSLQGEWRERNNSLSASRNGPTQNPVQNRERANSLASVRRIEQRPEQILYPQYRPVEEKKALSPYVSLAASPVQRLRGMGLLNVRRALYERGDS